MLIKRKKIISIFGWVALVIVFAVAFFFVLPLYVRNYIDIPPEGIFTVDQKSVEKFENGSEKYPFKTIDMALSKTKSKNTSQTIMIKDGLYHEQLELTGKITLLGLGEVKIENDIITDGVTVSGGEVMMQNLKLVGGHNGIELKKNAKLKLYNSEILGSKKFGLTNESSDEVENDSHLIISNSRIAECGSQGLYLRRANIVIKDSVIERNKEEGVDLHTGVVAIIKNCKIVDNGEGGIESEVGENRLVLENNFIARNSSSGINLQSSTENADIFISKNTINDNGVFGIRCSYHSDVTRPYFAKYVRIMTDNTFIGNGDRPMPGTCTNKEK